MTEWFWFVATLSVVAVVLALCALVAHVAIVAFREVGQSHHRALDAVTRSQQTAADAARNVAQATGTAVQDAIVANNPPPVVPDRKTMFRELLERAGAVDIELDDEDWTADAIPDELGMVGFRRADGTVVGMEEVEPLLPEPWEEWT